MSAKTRLNTGSLVPSAAGRYMPAPSIKLKSPGGLAELEKEPAYIRRNVKLNEVTPSDSSSVARYVLSPDDENNTEIKTNNSFLHDNVD